MALSNLSDEPAKASRGPDCTVCQALAELPEDKSTLIRQALANPRWRYTAIAQEVATDPDVPDWVRAIHHQTFRRHARGDCAARERLR